VTRPGGGHGGEDLVASRLQAVVARKTRLPCLLVDAADGHIAEASSAAAKLLGRRRTELRQLGVVKVARLAWRSEAMRLLLGGGVEAYSAASTVRRADGRMVSVVLWARVVQSAGGRWVVLSFTPEGEVGGSSLVNAVDQGPTVIGFGDGEGNIAMVSEDVVDLLGFEPEHLQQYPSTGFIHADDMPEYLLTVSTVIATGRARHLRIRVRHVDGHWVPVQAIAASLPRGHEHRMGFVLRADNPASESYRLEQLTELEARLRRVAVDLAAVGVSDHVDPDVARLLGELSSRQHEVVRLLQEGSRVPTIAQQLYLSQSTVRNHLSAIFRKFGVSSQEELLRVLRRAP
jgi:PAS domain S-box-containing protein